jgi:D-alanyl-D-alanine endopeptidase (penicillin-binding protein 7)
MDVRRAALATVWAIAIVGFFWDMLGTPAQADLQPQARAFGPERQPSTWVPPEWHPHPEALETLEAMSGHAEGRGLRLGSRSAFVFDVDAGTVLLEKSADERRPVASLTKLTSSLALASEATDLARDLEAVTCVDPQFWPNRSGAKSKLSTGDCYAGLDLLGAALVASDNRAAFGLQVVSGLPYDAFIERMNEVSGQLGMSLSTWADPSGLEDDNLSTARDMARAVVAVGAHPVLSVAASAPSWYLAESHAAQGRLLRTTDRLASRDSLDVLSAKTGYTDTAGYCFSALVRDADGHTIAMALLGAPRSKDRWADVDRVLAWVDAS